MLFGKIYISLDLPTIFATAELVTSGAIVEKVCTLFSSILKMND